MDKITFDPGISSELRAVNAYIKKRFCKTFKAIKIKESAWNRVFLVECQKPTRRFILKCSTSNADIRHEHASLLFLKNNGINNVPRIIAYDKWEGLYFLSLNFISNNDRINIKGQQELARVLASIHLIKARGNKNACLEQAYKTLSDVSCLVSYLNQARYLTLHKKGQKLAQLLNRTIERNKEHFIERKGLVFVNGDLGDDSIYCCDGQINIIDWHASGFADNAWDIARLFLNNAGMIDKRAFLKEYLIRIDDKGFTKRFEIYWQMNKLFTLLYFFFRSEWYSVPASTGPGGFWEKTSAHY